MSARSFVTIGLVGPDRTGAIAAAAAMAPVRSGPTKPMVTKERADILNLPGRCKKRVGFRAE